MQKSLKKGMLIVFAANILNLVLSLARNFVLPKYLDVSVYADLKTFQLYTSYAGLAALGYIDGMYLKYGGKQTSEMNGKGFAKNLSTFRIFQLVLMVILVIAGTLMKDIIFITMAFSVAFLNLTDYFKCFFQAVGEFSYYSRIMNMSAILIFAVDIAVLILLGADNSAPYLISNVAVYAIVWLVLEVSLYKKSSVKPVYSQFSFAELKKTTTSGFLLMIGLLMSNLLVGIDRWFVKFTFDDHSFAMYSFAASVLGFLSYASSPIAVTLYNYFCKERDKQNITFARGAICIFSVFLIACAFPVKFILEVYLDKYYASNTIMFVLFAGQALYILVKCYFINLYKANDKQNVFFKRVAVVLLLSAVSNIIFNAVFENMLVYAISTAVCAFVWLMLSCADFKEYRCTACEVLFVILSAVIFLICGLFLKSYVGFVVYVAMVLLLCLVFMKKHFVYIWGIIKGYSKKLLKR